MSKWQEVSSELDINYDSDTEVSVKSLYPHLKVMRITDFKLITMQVNKSIDEYPVNIEKTLRVVFKLI